MNKLTEKVVVEQEVTGVIADLCYFVRYLEDKASPTAQLSDEKLIKLARDFWETQHGEE